MTRKLAILDDYQSVATRCAPWQELEDLGIQTTAILQSGPEQLPREVDVRLLTAP